MADDLLDTGADTPDEPQAAPESGTPDEGHPQQEAQAPQPEDTEPEGGESTLYAGKYTSPEELEEAYINLQRRATQAFQETAELRRRIEELEAAREPAGYPSAESEPENDLEDLLATDPAKAQAKIAEQTARRVLEEYEQRQRTQEAERALYEEWAEIAPTLTPEIEQRMEQIRNQIQAGDVRAFLRAIHALAAQDVFLEEAKAEGEREGAQRAQAGAQASGQVPPQPGQQPGRSGQPSPEEAIKTAIFGQPEDIAAPLRFRPY